jgi:hypothetical protein
MSTTELQIYLPYLQLLSAPSLWKKTEVRFLVAACRLHELTLWTRCGILMFSTSQSAGVTQLVECNLAKVDVAGSNPVSRSNRAHDPDLQLPRGTPALRLFSR